MVRLLASEKPPVERMVFWHVADGALEQSSTEMWTGH